MVTTFRKATEAVLAEIRAEMKIRRTKELFLLFSLGSQFDGLIKLALDKLGVYCLVADSASVTIDDVLALNPLGIILSGGPASVYLDAPPFDERIFSLKIPVLGICLGFQLWARHIGAPVTQAEKREFGTHTARIFSDTELFYCCSKSMRVLESHGDIIQACPTLQVLATTDNAPVAAGRSGHLYGVQFHPEVTETECGLQIFENFCFSICGAKDSFPAGEIASEKIIELRRAIGRKRLLLALSGGSDSSVVAYLLERALRTDSKQVLAVYIKGIDRPDDERQVLKSFGNKPWLQLKIVDATSDFLEVLAGITEMAKKRVAMRSVYKKILEEEARAFQADFVVQGTLFTDISESGGGFEIGAEKAQIKLHHNVNLGFSLPELTPLVDCVKDGARNIGRSIGTPEELLIRHPFPGPGLVVRIEGAIDADKLRIARVADGIYVEELRRSDLYGRVWQAGAVVTKSLTTCTKGDGAANGLILTLWAVTSVNGFTARWAELPYDFLRHVSQRITNEIREVGAVTYRISDKPPATIEWG